MLWSDPDAAGVCKGTTEECGGVAAALIDRGQDEVESHISWLLSSSLRGCCFLMLSAQLHLSCLLSGRLLMSVFNVPCCDSLEPGGAQTALHYKSGSLLHLCGVFNEPFLQAKVKSLLLFIGLQWMVLSARLWSSSMWKTNTMKVNPLLRTSFHVCLIFSGPHRIPHNYFCA